MNAIQGTKPTGHQWTNILTNVLQVHKYKQNHIDHAVFIYCSPEKTETQIVCVSTDDFVCAFTHQQGPKLSYLNLNIEQHSQYISLDQTAHIPNIVDTWFSDSTDIHATDAPFRTDSDFEKASSETLPAEPDELLQLEQQFRGPSQTTLGQFQYVKEWTRPELSYAISLILDRSMLLLQNQHFKNTSVILRQNQ
eukprot:scaffold21618_cov63-Attheya_sp.AAC.5